MSENKTAQPEPSPAKLVLEMAQNKQPEFTDEVRKRLKAWLKKWSIRVGSLLALVGTNIVSFNAGAGEDLSKLWDFGGFAAVAILVFVFLNKVK